MAWKVIEKTGSLCLMMVFLATGAMANENDQIFRQEVRDAFTLAGNDGDLDPTVVSDAEDFIDNQNNTDGAVWNLYVTEFSQINDDINPDFDTPGSPYCVASAGAGVSCNNGGS